MIFQLFPILCGLATVVFTADVSNRQLPFWGGGLAVILALGTGWLPGVPTTVGDPQEYALVIAAAAFMVLHHHDWQRVSAVMGGVSAALWMQSLLMIGAPQWPALALVLLVAAVTLYSSARRRQFVSAELLDEALVGLIVMALLIALVPAVIQGWQAATALQAIDTDSRPVGYDGLVLGVAAAAIVLGCLVKLIKLKRMLA